MKVAVVWNHDHSGILHRFGQPSPERYGRAVVENVLGALAEKGHDARLFEGDKHLLARLQEFIDANEHGRPSGLVFNMAYGIQGECRYTHVPAALEMAGIPYTGSSPLGHALALDKAITKRLIRDVGVPTPAFRVMRTGLEPLGDLRFPLVTKPLHESTSFGLQLVHDPESLAPAVQSIRARYHQDALVEEYIEGREICVALLGNETLEALPFVEHDFGERETRLITWEDKSHRGVAEPQKICPPKVEPGLAAQLREISIATFRACHCRDYARVDIRIDRDGRPFVLEINSMAALGATASYAVAARAAGMSFADLIDRIVEVAWRRYHHAFEAAAGLEAIPAVPVAREASPAAPA